MTSEMGETGEVGADGAPGADGDRGEVGPVGPTGADGPALALEPYMVGSSVAIESGVPGYAQAECEDPSDVLMTGGCAADVALVESRPAVGSFNGGARPRWLCSTVESAEPQMLSSYAVCLPR